MSSAIQRALSTWQADPVAFNRDVLGVFLWSKQREIARSVWAHERTAVKAGHGVGKTAAAANVALTFLHVFPHSRVITTAPTFSQVRHLLWAELNSFHEHARVELGSTCLNTECHVATKWFALGLSTNDPDRMVGQHAPYVLVVIDEAFGVDPYVFEAAETYMTAAGNEGTMARILAIGNPTDPASPVARAWKSERELWNRITISAFDSPAVSITAELDDDGEFIPKTEAQQEKVPLKVRRVLTGDSWIRQKAKQYGIGGPLWLPRVLGEFPEASSNAVISVASIEAAQVRDCEVAGRAQQVIACDPARFGDDETTIASRIGDRARLREVVHGQDTMTTAGKLYRVWTDEGRPRVVVDSVGIGAGICDRLREMGVDVDEFNSAEAAMEPDEYPNARSEMWFRGADMMETLDLDGDEQLAADLAAPVYRINSRGQREVEPKDKTKQRLGRSPDRADAILMTLVPPAAMRSKRVSHGWVARP